MYRVGRRRRSGCASIRGAAIGTLPFWDYDPNSEKRTPIGGQFAWGGTPLKRYQGRAMVDSSGSETH
jgi:hypothetical protein